MVAMQVGDESIVDVAPRRSTVEGTQGGRGSGSGRGNARLFAPARRCRGWDSLPVPMRVVDEQLNEHVAWHRVSQRRLPEVERRHVSWAVWMISGVDYEY